MGQSSLSRSKLSIGISLIALPLACLTKGFRTVSFGGEGQEEPCKLINLIYVSTITILLPRKVEILLKCIFSHLLIHSLTISHMYTMFLDHIHPSLLDLPSQVSLLGKGIFYEAVY